MHALEGISAPTAGGGSAETVFFAMAGVLNVIGCFDGTHLQLQAPVINEYEYVNRSSKNSINIHIM